VDSLIYLTQRVATDLQLLPYGDYDSSALASDVPSKTMYKGLDNEKGVLTAATCSWVKNATVSPSNGCPEDVGAMCAVDYSSWDNVRKSYAALHIKEYQVDDGAGHRSNKAAVAAGAVVGVVVGLGLLAGLFAVMIIKRRRQLEEIEAAFEAKLSGAASVEVPPQEAAPAPITTTTTTGGAPLSPVSVVADSRV